MYEIHYKSNRPCKPHKFQKQALYIHNLQGPKSEKSIFCERSFFAFARAGFMIYVRQTIVSSKTQQFGKKQQTCKKKQRTHKQNKRKKKQKKNTREKKTAISFCNLCCFLMCVHPFFGGERIHFFVSCFFNFGFFLIAFVVFFFVFSICHM